MRKKGYVSMKREMIEKAVNELDLEIIEKNLDASGIRRRNRIKQAILLAAATALLLFAGILLKNSLIMTDPAETGKQADNETETGGKNSLPADPAGNYSVALAKYPDFPKISDLLKIREKTNALADSGWEAFTKKTADRILGGSGSKNTVYSPANLYLALCMLAEAAGNDSRDEVLELTGLSDIEEARRLADSVWNSLYRGDASGMTLAANSLWLDEAVPFHEEIAAALSERYYADVFSVPIGEAGTDEALKEWVRMRTGSLLKDTKELPETEQNTLLLLISALYYSDTWWDHFIKEYTAEDIFTTASGDRIQTSFMHSVSAENYYREEGSYTLAALPMESGASMVFLLPDEGTSLQTLIEQGKVTESLLQWKDKDAFSTAAVYWSVPKFEAESELSMTDTLKSLGVRKVFEPDADLSPLIDPDPEGGRVSKMQHICRVSVNEEGCEAAEFTYIEDTGAVYPGKTDAVIDMNLNRPFAFMITGVDGLPLLIGVVNEV